MAEAKELISSALDALKGRFDALDSVERHNTRRILDAFKAERIAERHFQGTTGYGYGDDGRRALGRVYARAFGCEAALVRSGIASGTHAIASALFALTRPGQRILSVTGAPYDTLLRALGVTGYNEGDGSLRDYGVLFDQVELRGGEIDIEAAIQAISSETALVLIQRSCGYARRRSLSPTEIGEAARKIKAACPHVTVFVDNCYGEFACESEPVEHGADIMAGSLIKNPGGGLAPAGGYIAGRRDLVEKCAARLTAPGVGDEIGSYEGGYRLFFQGCFIAPHAVNQAVKTALLFSHVFGGLGYDAFPSADVERNDIIQQITLGNPEGLKAFCRAVQAASPVDGFAVPEPWDMPGYEHQVIMAAGTFVSGSTIELSCDGPMRPPYTAYIQGALTLSHGIIALEEILRAML